MASIKLIVTDRPKILFFTLWIFLIVPARTVSADYPRILRLDTADAVFAQLEAAISEYYQAAARNRELPALQIYSYTTREEQSIFSLAAKCNLTYETVATVNRFDKSGTIDSGTTLLIPNIPGLFVPFEAENELEHLMRHSMEKSQYESYPVIISRDGKAVPYHFIPGSRFSSEELSYFLGVFFHHPLPAGKGALSSLYGQRRHPFTGDLQFHYGIDLASDIGTEVLATRYGEVVKKGYDDMYGYYVLLRHSGNYKSFYGHLSYIAVELNQTVKSGSIIGTVGSTGISTGPHLHFEIWQNDSAVDPLHLLPKDY
jgi:murein DD-endopeptidase MepM/ murein hydrolase activator NlpD